MKFNRFAFLLFITVITAASGRLYAQDNTGTGIVSIAEETGAELKFDYWKGLWELQKGTASVRIASGATFLLLDYESLYYPVSSSVAENGELLLDSASVQRIRDYFASYKEPSGRVACIVLDPGHGGKDPGAIGYYEGPEGKIRVNEKDVVLEIALQTEAMLKQRFPEIKVLLTRDYDWYPTLEERTDFANSIELKENDTMIFVSLHANASFNPAAKGFEVWYLPPEYRRDLIDPEMFSDVDEDVLPILNTMLEEELTVESVILGEKLLKSLDTEIGSLTDNRGPKEESWFVVRNARMPSVLIETGFVTNPEEAELLSTTAYLKKLSKGIYNGITDFITDFENDRRGIE